MSFDSFWSSFSGSLAKVLPLSPFQQFISSLSGIPYLGYLNWFVPVRACLLIFSSWLAALALYYLYSIILRWIKVIA